MKPKTWPLYQITRLSATPLPELNNHEVLRSWSALNHNAWYSQAIRGWMTRSCIMPEVLCKGLTQRTTSATSQAMRLSAAPQEFVSSFNLVAQRSIFGGESRDAIRGRSNRLPESKAGNSLVDYWLTIIGLKSWLSWLTNNSRLY